MSRSIPPPPMDPEAGKRGGSRGGRPAGPPLSLTSDPYDALADLFLGEEEHQAGTPQTRGKGTPRVSPDEGELGGRGEPSIEGVLLGHLPVTGVAWANQYARHVAEQRGELVGVVKLVAGQGAVELVGAGAAGLEGELGGPARTLGQAVRTATRWAKRWLIRVDEPAEHALLAPGAVDALTLLTGVDEAAVVASYRTLKSLNEEVGAGPELGLALMGSAGDRAEEASAKLTRAAETFLGREVRVSACVTKIGPGRAVVLFRGPIEDAAELVAEIGREIRGREATRSSEPPSRSKPGPAWTEEDVETLLAASDEAAGQSRQSAAAGARAPEPTSEPRTEAGAKPLGRHIAGLATLRAVCPYAPGVELAAGEDGSLHVLAGGEPGAEREAVERLLAAAAWAADHAGLLRLTGPEAAGVRTGGRPVMHLFTGDAKAVRRLLDSELRVHLLVRAEVDGRPGWACADLN